MSGATAYFLCLVLAADPAPVLERTVERIGVIGRVQVEPAVVPLIGVVTLSIQVEAAAPLTVEPIRWGALRGWRVKATAEPAIATPTDGRQRWQQSIRLIPDQPGELTLPLPPLRVRPGGRESIVELTFEPFTVRVTTELPRVDLDEARDVTGPESAPPAESSVARGWLASALVLAFVLGLGCWWRTRRGGRRAPKLTTIEWLNAELARLAALDPAAPIAAEALSATARGYLARHFQLAAQGRTTAELVALLPAEAPASWRELLERCDLANFARAGFTTEEWAAALAYLRSSATLTSDESPVSAKVTGSGQIA